jgi:hypothetical protein
MERTLKMVKQESATQTDSTEPWSERAPTTHQLFCGQDEAGRRGWFFRVDITGLYPRRIGPFPTRAEARECFEDLLAEIILEPLLNLQNDLASGPRGRYAIEGVPTLTRLTKGR